METPSSMPPEIDSPNTFVAVVSSTPATSDKDFWVRRTSGSQQPTLHRVMPELILLLGYVMVCFAIFAASLLVPYGFTDSYDVMANGLLGTLDHIDIQVVSSGRPVFALLQHLAFSSIKTVADLRYLRLAAMVGVGILAWTFYQALRRAGIRQPFALAIPLLTLTTPPYEVYVAWEVCAFFPYAALLAGAALLVADHALKKRLTKQGLLLGGASVVLLSISLMIYQPAAMVFWVFAAIFLLGRPASLQSAAKRLGAYGMVMALTLGLDYLASLLLPEMIYGARFPSSRTTLVHHLFTKAIWFLREPLVNALNVWNLLPNILIAVFVAVVALSGLLLFLPGNLVERGGKFLIALILVPLSYLPNLLVQENAATYRTQVGLTSLVVLYASFALLGWLSFGFQAKALKDMLSKRQKPVRKLQISLASTVLVAGVLWGSLLAARNVTSYFVLPQAEELSVMASQLNGPALAQAKSIYIIACTRDDTLSSVLRYDEFGLPSCSQFWVPRPMVYILLHELHPAKLHIPITLVLPGHSINPPPGSLVIDMRTLNMYRTADVPAGFAGPDG